MAAPIEVLRAALGDRYRVDREIGRGGMASVFLAEDLRHGRQVAIKVLDPQLAALIGPERFLREIQTAARLTHPHILPVHDSGAAGELLYYVMPHVEGESLRARLSREHQLPIPDATRLAVEMARALDYAHAKGVVHRDIKPENVLLESGQAVLADFGIARAVVQSAGERLTETGVSVGTPLYMSPEQTTGAPVDGRSDLYSLGCVLYEMIAGQPPFTGATAANVAHQHLAATPRPIADLRPSVPAVLAQVIARALSKTPADRYQTGSLMADALEASLAAGATPPVDSAGATVAMSRGGPRRMQWAAISLAAIVLVGIGWLAWDRGWIPLRHQPPMDPNKRDWVLVADFDAPDSSLGAAVRDLISTALDQSTIVRAVPPNGIREALAAAGRSRDARVDADLARELAYRRSVRAIVAGSVTRTGHTYAITARVEDVDSARVIATATETAKSEDAIIPAAGRLGAILRRRLGEESAAVRSTRPLNLSRTPSFEALQLLNTGLRLQLVNGDYRAAAELFRRATFLDPEFAGAWANLATAKSNGGDNDSAILFVKRALQCHGRFTEAQRLSSEANLAFYEDDIPRSVNLLRRSIELGNVVSRGNLAARVAALGRMEESLAIRKELEQDPWARTTPNAYNMWLALLCLGRVEEASQISAGFHPPRSKFAPAAEALVGERWATADSLGSRLLGDVSEDPELRYEGGLDAAGAKAARGDIARARADLEEAISLVPDSPDDKRWALCVHLLLDLLSARSTDPAARLSSRDTTEQWQGYLAYGYAVSGDTARARSLAVALRHASRWEARLNSVTAEGVIDWRGQHLQRVLEKLGPTASSRLFESRLPSGGATYTMRWLVGNAWERLGRLDSATVYFELAREHGRSVDVDFQAHAIALPFALQRLVVLYARMGRALEAEQRWTALQQLVTRPDAEFRPLMEQARAEIAGLRAREAPARRSGAERIR